jgi:hypothetical protein
LETSRLEDDSLPFLSSSRSKTKLLVLLGEKENQENDERSYKVYSRLLVEEETTTVKMDMKFERT